MGNFRVFVLSLLIISCSSFQFRLVGGRHRSVQSSSSSSNSRVLRNRKTALSSTYTSTVAPDKIPSTATIEKKSSFLKLPAAVYEPAAATAVGLVTAYTVVASKNLINAIDKASISKFALAPLLGTAFVALAYKFEPNLGTGQGVIPSTQSTTLPNLRLRFMRWLCVVIGLGTGSGMAFTSPSAEMGMVFGRMISRFVDFISKDELSQETKNNLCLAGSAAGVAANFQTPLTGAFFALEVNRRYLQGKEPKSGKLYHILDNPSGAPMIILASAAAAYLTRAGCWLGGTHPLKLTEYTLGAKFNSFQEFLAFGTVGLFAGFGALLYQKMCEVISKSLKKLPSKNIAPLFGGAVCTGLAFLGRPQNLPTGYKALNDVFNGKITGFRPLATIVTERLVSLASCSASGVIGGAFAPCMFIGSALGALVHAGRANLLRALAFSEILISGTSSMSVYAAVGTAAFVSSMQRSPITGAICIMELTNNFSLMLPTLIGSTIATYIVGKFQKSD